MRGRRSDVLCMACTCCSSRASMPSSWMLPLVTSYRRTSSLRMVDLPLPLGPTSATLCPGSTLKFTPATTSLSPVYPKCTSCGAANCLFSSQWGALVPPNPWGVTTGGADVIVLCTQKDGLRTGLDLAWLDLT